MASCSVLSFFVRVRYLVRLQGDWMILDGSLFTTARLVAAPISVDVVSEEAISQI